MLDQLNIHNITFSSDKMRVNGIGQKKKKEKNNRSFDRHLHDENDSDNDSLPMMDKTIIKSQEGNANGSPEKRLKRNNDDIDKDDKKPIIDILI